MPAKFCGAKLSIVSDEAVLFFHKLLFLQEPTVLYVEVLLSD